MRSLLARCCCSLLLFGSIDLTNVVLGSELDDGPPARGSRLAWCVSTARHWADAASDAKDRARGTIRLVTAHVAARATEAQADNYGLHLPDDYSPEQSLVVLVHGFDSSARRWDDMARLLEEEGFQVARFSYPNDQPIAESARLFARELKALARCAPVKLHLVAHSMGCLIARDYIEGREYAGAVDRLILIAPPNHGAVSTHFSLASEAMEHYRLWRQDPRWSPTWAITDGMGEATRDLLPDSLLLAELNARPRRAGVRYTIVAGSRHCACRYTARALRGLADGVPECRLAGPMRGAMMACACNVECRECDSDGAVAIESAHLEGITDEVVLEADHTTLYCARDGREPAAWPVIRQRLVAR